MLLLSLSHAALLLASQAPPQEVPPNAPHVVQSLHAPGVEVRYLDFGWNSEAFATLEKGGTAPAGRRSWVLARLMFKTTPHKWQGHTIPVGSVLLVLNPASGGKGPTLELRSVDMREVFTNLNVIAEPPAGETYGVVPAAFEKADTTAERLTASLAETAGALELTVHYGDRKLAVALAPLR